MRPVDACGCTAPMACRCSATKASLAQTPAARWAHPKSRPHRARPPRLAARARAAAPLPDSRGASAILPPRCLRTASQGQRNVCSADKQGDARHMTISCASVRCSVATASATRDWQQRQLQGMGSSHRFAQPHGHPPGGTATSSAFCSTLRTVTSAAAPAAPAAGRIAALMAALKPCCPAGWGLCWRPAAIAAAASFLPPAASKAELPPAREARLTVCSWCWRVVKSR